MKITQEQAREFANSDGTSESIGHVMQGYLEHQVVFQSGGKFWRFSLWECADGSEDFGHDVKPGEEITCEEVEAYEVTTTEYREVKNAG